MTVTTPHSSWILSREFPPLSGRGLTSKENATFDSWEREHAEKRRAELFCKSQTEASHRSFDFARFGLDEKLSVFDLEIPPGNTGPSKIVVKQETFTPYTLKEKVQVVDHYEQVAIETLRDSYTYYDTFLDRLRNKHTLVHTYNERYVDKPVMREETRDTLVYPLYFSLIRCWDRDDF